MREILGRAESAWQRARAAELDHRSLVVNHEARWSHAARIAGALHPARWLRAVGEPASERRAAPRVRIGAPVSCVVGERGVSFQAHTVDVSMSGVLLVARAAKPHVGEEVTMWFSFFPGSSEVPIRGRVARHTASGFAVHFADLSASEGAMLRRALPGGVV
jgi:hypothetical protein